MKPAQLPFLSALLSLSLLLPLSYAEELISDDLLALNAFQNYKEVGPFDIVVPTVVELPFSLGDIVGYDLAVLENETGELQPWYLNSTSQETRVSSSDSALTDGSSKTYVEYELPEEGTGKAVITLTAAEAVTSSSLSFVFDRNVARPSSIEVRVLESDETEKTILAESKMTGTTVSFPSTTAQTWYIEFNYSQLLRVNEVELTQENVNLQKSVRFLAQPDYSYKVYFNADGPVDIETGESGNLTDDEGVLELSAATTKVNSSYEKMDSDEDGVPNDEDNCVNEANADQTDEDENGRGDLCDDHDKDSVINAKDNCPSEPNRYQEDEDGDGMGDACDDEESRLTEKYTWLPWLGMGLAALVIGFLFYRALRK